MASAGTLQDSKQPALVLNPAPPRFGWHLCRRTSALQMNSGRSWRGSKTASSRWDTPSDSWWQGPGPVPTCTSGSPSHLGWPDIACLGLRRTTDPSPARHLSIMWQTCGWEACTHLSIPACLSWPGWRGYLPPGEVTCTCSSAMAACTWRACQPASGFSQLGTPADCGAHSHEGWPCWTASSPRGGEAHQRLRAGL